MARQPTPAVLALAPVCGVVSPTLGFSRYTHASGRLAAHHAKRILDLDQRAPACPARVARWGHFGTPVLLFPTAGGDFEEVERFHLVGALRELIDAGRIKVFSVDGVAAGTGCAARTHPSTARAPRACSMPTSTRRWCRSSAAIARATPSRSSRPAPHSVRTAPCPAVPAAERIPRGHRAERHLRSVEVSGERLHARVAGRVSPARSARSPKAATPHDLRRRFVLLATGEGEYETPAESKRMSAALGAAGMPTHLEMWGRDFAHGWNTWREMLPRYLARARLKRRYRSTAKLTGTRTCPADAAIGPPARPRRWKPSPATRA